MAERLIFREEGAWTIEHTEHLVLLFLLQVADPHKIETNEEDRTHMDFVMSHYFPNWWSHIRLNPRHMTSRKMFRRHAKRFLAAIDQVGNDFGKLWLKSGPTFTYLCTHLFTFLLVLQKV